MGPRWIVVAGAPFVPAQDGGEREHLGFVEALLARDWLSALVVPTDAEPAALGRDDDLAALAELIAPAPLITTPRRRSIAAAAHINKPFVVASRPAPGDLADRVAMQAPDSTGIVLFAFKSRQPGQLLAQRLGLPVVLRHHNLEQQYHADLAGSMPAPKRVLVLLEAKRVGAEEARLEHAPWLTGIADISAADAAVRTVRSAVPVRHVPSFALGASAPGGSSATWTAPDRPIVTFLGALHVGTNHDALEWFGTQVWPRVRQGRPDAIWRVVGRSPTPRVRDLVQRTPGAELHPDVADPSSWLLDSSVAVNPAVSGSGVNIKLIEYLSVGVPVVSTTKGMAGLGLSPGRDLLVADDPEEFAKSIVSLLNDRQVASRLGAAGRSAASEVLDVDRSLTAMAALMDAGPWTSTQQLKGACR